MTCAEAREYLLETDLRSPDAELAAHLDGCAGCRALAEHLRGAERELARMLAGLAPATGTDTAIRRAAAESRRRVRMRRAAGIVTLAAAAALAAVVLTNRPARLPGIAAVASAPARLSVTAPPGSNVAVLKTDNPDVVVFWFFQ
ncbi:MAG TPA: hypothetical protein VI160_05795 [Gemmatimonadales bacterium]